MNPRLLVIVSLVFLSSSILLNSASAQTTNSTIPRPSNNDDYLIVTTNSEGLQKTFSIPLDKILFDVSSNIDPVGNSVYTSLSLKPDLQSFYDKVGFSSPSQNVVFVYPLFTKAAYGNSGFYDYYKKKCDTTCLTVPLDDITRGKYSSSVKGISVLKLLNYSYVTDLDVDKNPDILKKYDKVIVLHNEYVTKREFDAITRHPHVVFLYPNPLYAEVMVNYDKNTITLVRGHSYPDPSIKNGFNWKYDNSRYEYDVECNNWNFYKRYNYTFLNCYPEYRLLHDKELLYTLSSNDPTNLLDDLSNWLRYSDNKKMVETFLGDFDIAGDYIPSWVKQPASMTANGEITRDELENMVQYLYANSIIR